MNLNSGKTDLPGTSAIQIWILAAITLAVWATAALWPRLLATAGLQDFGTPYLDSYAILAAVDAARMGNDPHLANSLDPLMRGHVYSDWWLWLQYLGLTRAHNQGMAMVWIGGFGLAAWVTSRPRNWGETLWLASILISPSVLLAVKRANNDLVIFVLLAGCGLAVSADRWLKQAFAIACLGLAAGLKYFPATGVLAFLWVRPIRRMPAAFLCALVVVGTVMNSVAGQVDRARFFVGSGFYTMGAAIWWRDFGWKDAQSAIPAVLVLVVAGMVCAMLKITTGLATRGMLGEKFRSALGAIILLTCFLSGVSYAYRWIFLIWPAIWVWRQTRDKTLGLRERAAAIVACILIPLCLWLDGTFCIFANRFLRGIPPAAADEIFYKWRLWTQPLHWILMMLLAGWLIEGAWQTAREWWSTRYEA